MLEKTTAPRRPKTLSESLAGVAAHVRGQVHGELGTHPYRLFLVVRKYHSGRVGVGSYDDVKRTELGCNSAVRQPGGRVTPPKITLDGQFSRLLQGVVDQGVAVIEELDGRHTEADFSIYGRLAPDEESFLEIVQDARDGTKPDRPVGRYAISGRPRRVQLGTSWALILQAQEPSAPFGEAELTAEGTTR